MQVNSINNYKSFSQNKQNTVPHTTKFCGTNEIRLVSDFFKKLTKDDSAQKLLLDNPQKIFRAIKDSVADAITSNLDKKSPFFGNEARYSKKDRCLKFFRKSLTNDRDDFFGRLYINPISRSGENKICYVDKEVKKAVKISVFPEQRRVLYGEKDLHRRMTK